MHADRLVIPFLLVLLAASALPLPAQVTEALRRDCDPQVVQDLDLAEIDPAWIALHPTTVRARFAGRIQRGEWLGVVSAIADDFHATSATLPEDTRASFGLQLDSLRTELAAIAASPDYESLVARAAGVRQTRFRIERDPEEPVYDLFLGYPSQITFDEETSPTARRRLCWRAITLDGLLVLYGESGRERATAALSQMISLWDSYNRNSYSQYPWELWVNGLTGDELDLAPPRQQWIFLHPSIGVEVAGSWDELHRLDVLTLEPIGFLRYNPQRTSYTGVSLLATLPSDAGVGVGALVHLGRIAKLGYVIRDGGAAAGSGLVLSLDAYGFLAGVPASLQGAKERIEGLRDTLR